MWGPREGIICICFTRTVDRNAGFHYSDYFGVGEQQPMEHVALGAPKPSEPLHGYCPRRRLRKQTTPRSMLGPPQPNRDPLRSTFGLPCSQTVFAKVEKRYIFHTSQKNNTMFDFYMLVYFRGHPKQTLSRLWYFGGRPKQTLP